MGDVDGPPAELVQRIADAVEDIERNVSDLRELQELSRSEYRSDANGFRRDAVERKFEKLTAATLDIAKTILRIERETVPERRKRVISELHAIGVIDDELDRKLREAVGFRDVLAHSYGPIVNDDLVYDALQNSLDRYVHFVEAVHQYLSESIDWDGEPPR